eukprot:TRINITY_DN3790_c3_g1_i1.p1 TRINITY_DN3790_c3_g1~~TRINITY_DN3790_c3_g1_i1.p1  ORF type:complete len:537 (-),score=98.68 TRINITY_DN3790_c3_g1_i1:38-1648(-)
MSQSSSEQFNWEVAKNRINSFRVVELHQFLRTIGIGISGQKAVLLKKVEDYINKSHQDFINQKKSEEEIKKLFATIDQLHANLRFPSPSTTIMNPHISFSNNNNNNNSSSATSYSSSSSSSSSNSYPLSAISINRFHSNPFLVYQKTIISTVMKSLRETQNQPMQIEFHLPKDIFNNTYSIHLIILDSKSPEHHVWPVTFEFNVNGRPQPIKRATKKEKDKPADISTSCKPDRNIVSIRSSVYGQYIVVINLFKKMTPKYLIDQVLSEKVLDFQQSLSKIQKLIAEQSSDEIQTMSSKISLLDAWTRKRINMPVRANTCNHIQCMELESHILANEKQSKWNCPNCSKKAEYKDLFVDSYFLDILKQTPPSVEEVEFHKDGSWSIPSPNNKRQKVTYNNDPIPQKKATQVFSLESDDEELTNQTSMNSQQESNSNTRQLNLSSDNTRAGSITEDSNSIGDSIEPCYVCKQPAEKRCSSCRSAVYCSQKCQYQDWQVHRLVCAKSPVKTENPSSMRPQTEIVEQSRGGSLDDPITLDD